MAQIGRRTESRGKSREADRDPENGVNFDDQSKKDRCNFQNGGWPEVGRVKSGKAAA